MDKFVNPPLHDVMGAMPAAALIGAGALFVVGLIVWLMGRKLARPTCVISGLVLGGIGGMACGRWLGESSGLVLPLVVGCAIAGALLAALLFRLWVAVVGAVLLSLLVPAGSLVWHGTPPPGVVKPAINATQSAGQAKTTPETGASKPGAATQPTVRGVATKTYAAVMGFYKKEVEQIDTWWNKGLDSGGRRLVYVGAAAGALVGLILGLLMPYVAASLESALVGAILLFFPGTTLLRHFSPGHGGLVPSSPRAIIISLCLITAIGFLFQWTLFRRSADK